MPLFTPTTTLNYCFCFETKRLNGSGTVGRAGGGEAGAEGRHRRLMRQTEIIWMLQVLKTIILLS